MKFSSFEKLLEKEMERKDFLLYLGFFVLAITGISGLIKSVNESFHTDTNSSGFGYGSYGGLEESRKHVS